MAPWQHLNRYYSGSFTLINISHLDSCFEKNIIFIADIWKNKSASLFYLLLWAFTSLTIMQNKIFEHPPPNVRKIVLATNMAEASITINDVVFVVDCGKAKETTYDALNNTPCLLPSWISQASARQVSYLYIMILQFWSSGLMEFVLRSFNLRWMEYGKWPKEHQTSIREFLG